ncbi:MAG TPA: L,D-transpeptidase [Longimicrobiales bacterium]|nr:L,D-transpeptidase [Longimicrobiales bacterium]
MTFSIRRLSLTAGLIVVAAGAGANYAYEAPATEGDDEEGLRLVVNVPANRLYVYEDGVRTRTYAVSVGLQGYETPAGSYTIREVIWNPWWHPPQSDWAAGRKPEPPGESNPMGRVKLNFGPLLYIHGTSAYQSLGAPASRGCVRMRNSDVIELARLVHEYASPKVDGETLDMLIDSPSMTRTIRLAKRVKFTAEYNVATVDDGFLILYPDVYKRMRSKVRDEVEQTLRDSGIDMADVNRDHLERLLEKSSTTRVAISLEDLVAPTPVAAGEAANSRER